MTCPPYLMQFVAASTGECLPQWLDGIHERLQHEHLVDRLFSELDPELRLDDYKLGTVSVELTS